LLSSRWNVGKRGTGRRVGQQHLLGRANFLVRRKFFCLFYKFFAFSSAGFRIFSTNFYFIFIFLCKFFSFFKPLLDCCQRSCRMDGRRRCGRMRLESTMGRRQSMSSESSSYATPSVWRAKIVADG
jgi:hypothetical protein